MSTGSKGPHRSVDGVADYPADAHDLATYVLAEQQLRSFSLPRLLTANNPHDRLFVAALDGTGNSLEDPNHLTNIGAVYDQLRLKQRRGLGAVHAEYVEGPGTQPNPITRTLDLATGYTYEARLEEMYDRLVRQAQTWLKQDPHARISVVDIGFSRGAEEAAGFARLLDARGIADPDSRRFVRDAQGHSRVTYTRTLVPPGQVAQVLVLLDPVGTGEPSRHDRRPPPSVLAGVQLTAEDERRNLFPSTRILDPGVSADGRFLNMTVGGSHSDVGGSYLRNGLATRSHNLVVDVLNGVADRPFLHKRPLPPPALDVVHRSEQGLPIYRTSQYDAQGRRPTIERLAPAAACAPRPPACLDAEPVDARLAARFARQAVRIGPMSPSAPQPVAASPAVPMPAGTRSAAVVHRSTSLPAGATPTTTPAVTSTLAQLQAANARSGAGLEAAQLHDLARRLDAAAARNPAMRRIDEVLVVPGEAGRAARVFGIYRPEGAAAPAFRVHVGVADAPEASRAAPALETRAPAPPANEPAPRRPVLAR